ncbi:unnamed protein product [Trichobilharzia regenti]|nr:unnamed protein product [Trichobilharzia regenti]
MYSDHFWCQRVQHYCCLSARRFKACQIGSDHIVKHNSENCSVGEFIHLVDVRLTPVARECCLCQLIWSKSSMNSNSLLENTTSDSNQSACPQGNCCSMLSRSKLYSPCGM